MVARVGVGNAGTARARIRKLEAAIRKASHAYYNTGFPTMTDAQFDALVEELRQLSPRSPALTNVGAPIAQGTKVKLPFPMMSLDKLKSGTPAWANRHAGPYVLADKLDGTSAMIAGGRMFRRGTGTHGADITSLARLISGAHLAAPGSGGAPGLVVRGEIIIRKKDAAQVVPAVAKDLRSAVNALVTAKTANAATAAVARFVAYEVVHPPMEKREQYAALARAGFETAWHTDVDASGIDDATLARLFEDRRKASPYAVDGIVVTAAGVHAPTAARNPAHAFAFKALVDGQGGLTTVREVTWSAGRDGRLAPRVRFDPVTTADGVTMQFATAHNARYVRDQGIGPGARIFVARSGDVIPTITSVRSAAEPDLPPAKPAWHWDSGGVHAVLDALGAASEVKLLVRFLTSLGVQGAREATVAKLHAAGFTSPSELVTARAEQLKPHIGTAAASKLSGDLAAALARADVVDLMVASGSFGLGWGERKLRALADAVPDLHERTPEQVRAALATEEGVRGVRSDAQITQAVEGAAAFKRFVKSHAAFQRAVARGASRKSGRAEKAARGTVVFTGFRDAELEKLAKAAGYAVAASVSRRVTEVVARNTTSSSSKLTKAHALGVAVVSERAFRNRLRKEVRTKARQLKHS